MSSVTLKASVGEVVNLSVSRKFSQDNVQIVAQSDPKALTITLSGSGRHGVAIRVPVLIRSNISYVISTLVQSQAVTLANFAVLDARPTGRFVAADAVTNLEVGQDLNRCIDGTTQTASVPLNVSSPLAILSGPRISLLGTLNSTDNALQVILLISVKPDAGADNWFLRLILSGSPGGRF